MKNEPERPPAPNPAAVASAQGAANREAAEASARLAMTEEITPYGTSTYEPTGTSFEVAGGDPIEQYRRTITLDPADQATLDIQRSIAEQLLETGQGQLERVSAAVEQPFSLEGLPPVASLDEGAREQVADSLYGRATARLDPVYELKRHRLENQLVNQGFARGSEGWNQAMKFLGFEETDAYEQARRAADAQAVAEQGRLFGLESAARERALTEALLERGLPLQELQAITGTAPGIVTPQFSPTPAATVAPADVVGPTTTAYQGDINAYNQQLAAQRATMGGIFGLGAAGLQGAVANWG